MSSSFHSSDPEDYRRMGVCGQRSTEEMSSDSTNGAGAIARPMRIQLPAVPCNPNSFVPLSVLLEFAIQKAYHDLIILTDLLPKRQDMERKISIVEFAHTIRQIFIRLLAIVKWAKSADRVESCMSLSYVLEQQANLYIDTADKLFALAREVLSGARLPMFQIPSAVDVLTLRTFPRMPSIIRDRFVVDPPLSGREKFVILRRLDKVIQHRLISKAYPLPERMRRVRIRNGMAMFEVPGEFEAALTLLGELPITPWTLLNIKILVKDEEIGEGLELIHPNQLWFLHNLVQGRMNNSDHPIQELYDVLHAFCVALQIEVLFCQAQRVIYERAGSDSTQIDEYQPAQKLTISYWRPPKGEKSLLQFKISVSQNGPNPLKVSHVPFSSFPLPKFESNFLKIDRLLTETTLIRAWKRLEKLNERIDLEPNWSIFDSEIVEVAPKIGQLRLKLHPDASENEFLWVGINMLTGKYVVTTEMKGSKTALEALEINFNSESWWKIGEVLNGLRLKIAKQRLIDYMSNLPAVAVMEDTAIVPAPNGFSGLAKNRLYVKIVRCPNYVLIVELKPKNEKNLSMAYGYHLGLVRTQAAVSFLHPLNVEIRPDSGDPAGLRIARQSACDLLQYGDLLQSMFDTVRLRGRMRRKEKKLVEKMEEDVGKSDVHEFPELKSVIGLCEHRIPLYLMAETMQKRGLVCWPNWDANALQVANISPAAIPDCPFDLVERFMHYCASLEISTIHERGSGLKLAFTWRTGADFPPNSVFRPGVVKPPNLPPRPVNELGAAVDDLLEKMATFSRIFGLICTFLPYAESFGDFLDVKLYNFYKIVIDYGPAASRDYSVIVNWNVKNSKFHLAFGSHSQRKNPHTTIAADLNSTLNSNQNLAEILQILVETWPVYEAVGRLWTAPIFTKDDFTTLHCLAKGQVVFWDCGRAQEGPFKWIQLPGLASLLQKFGNVELKRPAPAHVPLKCRDLKQDDSEMPATTAPSFRDPGSMEFSLASPAPMIPPSPLGAGIGPSGPLSVPNIPAASPAQPAMGPMTPSPAPGSTQAPVPMSPAPSSVIGQGLTTPSPAPPGSQTSVGHTGFTPSPSPAHGPPSQLAPTPSPAGAGIPCSDFLAGWSEKESPNKVQREECGMDEVWAALDFPIVIPHETLIKLCHVEPEHKICPLERYLSSLYMLMKLEPLFTIRSAAAITEIKASPGSLCCTIAPFRCEICIDKDSMTECRLKLTTIDQSDHFSAEDLAIFERYFAAILCRNAPNPLAIRSFLRALEFAGPNLQKPEIMRAFMNIMKEEMSPPNSSHRWHPELVWTVPPMNESLLASTKTCPIPTGGVSVNLNTDNSKMLFYIRLRTTQHPYQSLVIPITYDVRPNANGFQQLTLLSEQNGEPPQRLALIHTQVMSILVQQSQAYQDQAGEGACPIWPAVRSLTVNTPIPPLL